MGYDIYNNICLRYLNRYISCCIAGCIKWITPIYIYHKNKIANVGVSAKSYKESFERIPTFDVLFLNGTN